MTRDWRFWVYIMGSKSRHIYTGVTNDIERRVREHKEGRIEGFTRKYRVNRLVYFERFHYVGNAIAREKEIKSWDRQKRVALIESMNPTWEDLSLDWGKPVNMLSATSGGQQIPRFARDDNSSTFHSIGEIVQQQQIPRPPRRPRDDKSDNARSIGAELVWSNKS